MRWMTRWMPVLIVLSLMLPNLAHASDYETESRFLDLEQRALDLEMFTSARLWPTLNCVQPQRSARPSLMRSLRPPPSRPSSHGLWRLARATSRLPRSLHDRCVPRGYSQLIP